jgi:hypothetical protein
LTSFSSILSAAFAPVYNADLIYSIWPKIYAELLVLFICTPLFVGKTEWQLLLIPLNTNRHICSLYKQVGKIVFWFQGFALSKSQKQREKAIKG